MSIVDLADELTAWLWRPPTAGGLWNALLHMWGYYVRSYAAAQSPGDGPSQVGQVLATVQELTLTKGVSYLVHSTALGEFGCWIGSLASGEVCN